MRAIFAVLETGLMPGAFIYQGIAGTLSFGQPGVTIDNAGALPANSY